MNKQIKQLNLSVEYFAHSKQYFEKDAILVMVLSSNKLFTDKMLLAFSPQSYIFC